MRIFALSALAAVLLLSCKGGDVSGSPDAGSFDSGNGSNGDASIDAASATDGDAGRDARGAADGGNFDARGERDASLDGGNVDAARDRGTLPEGGNFDVVGEGGAANDGRSDAGLDGTVDAGAPLGTLIGDFIGVNGFIDDAPATLAAIGNVREYHNWSWCEGNGAATYPGYPANQNSFVLFNGFWDWDKYYADLKAKGVLAFPAIQGGTAWMNNGAIPPVPSGGDPLLPASYAAHADHLFQYAARYGEVQVADNLLKLAADQTRVSGLKALRYIEDFNEQDANWILPNGAPLFTPAQYAAMASADYDGHRGAMGLTFGVKSADPNMKLVMGGLAGSGSTLLAWEQSIAGYLDGMRTWSAANRGGSFPADVINLHYYAFGPDPFGTPNPRPAISPEAAKIEETMTLLRDYRNMHLPGKELWITEFGYDTDSLSRLRAPALGRNAAPVVQGQWLARTYLALLGAGFDRAFMFMLRDPCDVDVMECHVQFDTSGLTSAKGKWVPKPAYFFIATMRARLASFGFDGPLASGNANVRIAKFRDSKSSKRAFVLWASTSDDTVVPAFSLTVGAATKATLVTLADQQSNGVESGLPVVTGSVTLDVDESPRIVIVEGP
ncbi:MAG TPA: hypothetical protein VK550_18300 [Polyangiaceae bacterium]|nr:hypothetical protein [Polyangiaceae bacterium]